ncbi:MAG: DoxX family protein [Nanoarchaeota archaeon]|nr:MAG: DoxX family protein [Nanoarchaeota archaeon]
MKKILVKYQEHAYFAFRIIFGALFTLHGLMKWGVFGGTPVTPASGLLFGAAILEIIIGPLLVLGLATRVAASLGAIEMVVALISFHYLKMGPKLGYNPLNNGELPMLFFGGFIVLAVYGAGKWALDQKILKDWA